MLRTIYRLQRVTKAYRLYVDADSFNKMYVPLDADMGPEIIVTACKASEVPSGAGDD